MVASYPNRHEFARVPSMSKIIAGGVVGVVVGVGDVVVEGSIIKENNLIMEKMAKRGKEKNTKQQEQEQKQREQQQEQGPSLFTCE